MARLRVVPELQRNELCDMRPGRYGQTVGTGQLALSLPRALKGTPANQLDCERNGVKLTHDWYKNTCKCGEVKLHVSPSA